MAEKPFEGKTVVLVDDSIYSRRTAEEKLKELGLEVISIESLSSIEDIIKELNDVLAKHTVAFLLLDGDLGRVTGYEVQNAINKGGINVKTVSFSSEKQPYVDEPDFGKDIIGNKPELMEKIRKILNP